MTHGITLMTLPLRLLLMAIALLATLHMPVAAQEKPPLKKEQVERFLISFDAMLTMVTKYWGDRRFTAKGIIMPPRGTIERAMAEMEVEGTLQDFNRLFTSQGFDGYDAWRHFGQRIANAQFQIRATEKGNPITQLTEKQYATLMEKRSKFLKPDPQIPEEVRQSQLQTFSRVLAEHEKWALALRDMPIVKQYHERIQKLGRKRQQQAEIARRIHKK